MPQSCRHDENFARSWPEFGRPKVILQTSEVGFSMTTFSFIPSSGYKLKAEIALELFSYCPPHGVYTFKGVKPVLEIRCSIRLSYWRIRTYKNSVFSCAIFGTSLTCSPQVYRNPNYSFTPPDRPCQAPKRADGELFDKPLCR